MSANFESLVSSSGSLTVKYSTKDLWNGEYPCMTSLIPRWLKPIIRELMVWNPDFEQIGCTRLFMFLELFALLNVTSILELIRVEPHHRDDIATNIEAGIEYLIGKTGKHMVWTTQKLLFWPGIAHVYIYNFKVFLICWTDGMTLRHTEES